MDTNLIRTVLEFTNALGNAVDDYLDDMDPATEEMRIMINVAGRWTKHQERHQE